MVTKDPLDRLIDDACAKMKAFCKACQAIPTHGYCNMNGCPMPRAQQPADGGLIPETDAKHQDRAHCLLCANGNDLPDGKSCGGCGRIGHAPSALANACRLARGSGQPPSNPVRFSTEPQAVMDWTDLHLAAEAAEWLERQPGGVFGANDIEQRFRKLATPRAVLTLIAAEKGL